MTTYLAKLNDGSKIEVIRTNGIYTALDTGEIITPISLVSFNHITHDQYEFESLLKSYTLSGDFSKNERLMYRDTFMKAIYKTWRITKGLPIDDPEYRADTAPTQPIQHSPIYSSARYKGD
ncbi:hypothetical protein [Acinetobacter equi]|uniref:Uncharacterized protein n=1 Tax=Acinetobacter equi TaxID=1324350 RepID=A0A0N7GXU4_9GAMM|nr:hypothetical protein [Acinetobacter equi]ALH95683.1 hypothetical protein AOY20_09145 [Acinetobacter equi]